MSEGFFKQARIPAVLFLALAGAVACYEDTAPGRDAHDSIDVPPEGREAEAEADSPIDGREGDEEGSDGGRDPLICDAIYVPFVTFTFTDTSTGEAYCGPATITYEVVGLDETGATTCDCVEGVMRSGGFECHINPPRGETSRLTVSVEGYEDFVTEVTLPYVCEPDLLVDVLLRPVTDGCPPRAEVSAVVSGPQPYPESSLTISSDARVLSVGGDAGGIWSIAVDFSEFDPELGEVSFSVGNILEDVMDLSPGDLVHVDYSYERSLPMDDTRLVISRDTETLVLGYRLGHSGEDIVSFGAMTLDLIQGRCRPMPDFEGCALFERLGYSIACEALPGPLEVFDGSETTVPCGSGSGYEVIVGDLYQMAEDLGPCTDIPYRVTGLVIVKRR